MASQTTDRYTINLVGDVMLGRLIDQLFPTHVDEPKEAKHVASFVAANPPLQDYGPSSPWGNTLSLFHESDLNLINLETSVTASNKPWPDKVFNYRMHPANITALAPPRIDYASLANNHTLDFSEAGLRDTVQTLKKAGIASAGAGLNKEEATSPCILHLPNKQRQEGLQHRKQHKVQVWAASDHPADWAKVPGESSLRISVKDFAACRGSWLTLLGPGFHFIDYSKATKTRLKDLIEQTAAPDVCLKVISIHWGPNYAWQPAEEIRSLAHFLVDECGIDIIHGTSSHHVQGVETRKGKLIIYGCGDFVVSATCRTSGGE